MTGAEASPDNNESTGRNIEAGEEQPLLTSPPASIHDDDTSERNVIVTELWKSGPALALGTILFGADYALATASFPKIGSDFAQLRHVTWLTISFTVGVAASQPLYSRLSDVYGRKPLQLASYVCFAIGLIFCVVSPQFWWLVVARGVVGIGSSGMAYMVALILNDEIALQDRATWQGGLQLMALVGDFIGGPLGGALLDRLGWRWAFCLEIPVAALVFALVLWTLKTPQTPMQKPDALSSNNNGNCSRSSIVTSRFDFLGSLNLIFLVATFVLALNIAGNDVPWSHPIVPVLLSLGTLLFATFIYVELSPSRKPLIPVRLFLSRSLWSIAGVTFFKEMALMAITYITSFYTNVSGRGSTAIGGLLLSFISVGTVIGSFLAGFQIRRSGKVGWIIVIAFAIHLASAIVIQLRWKGNEALQENILEVLIATTASGAIYGATIVGSLKSTDHSDRAAIYAATHLIGQIAGLLSLAIIAAILQQRSTTYLRENLREHYTGDIPQIVESCLNSLNCIDPLPPSVQKLIRRSFVQAVGDSLKYICATVFAGLVFSFLSEDYVLKSST